MKGAADQHPDYADRVEAMGIVVPARNEELLLPRCLAALQTAVGRVLARRPGLVVHVVVVLDACVDGTADVVAAHPFVEPVPVALGCVGAARAAGATVVANRNGLDDQRLWLLTTDADSAVPADWLTSHLDLAESGLDVVVGTVEPDPADLPAEVLRRWRGQHRLVLGHSHVHGANLGMRFSSYAAAGGFEALATHEDVRLVRRLGGIGARTLATPNLPVRTSGRTVGRAPGGFAAYVSVLMGGGPTAEPAHPELVTAPATG